MDGIDFDVLATAPSVSAVPFLADSGLPDLGTLQMKAKMTSKGGKIDIGKCTLRAGPDENPTFSMKGRILGIEDLEKTAAEIPVGADAGAMSGLKGSYGGNN